jgi:hypothetical protein
MAVAHQAASPCQAADLRLGSVPIHAATFDGRGNTSPAPAQSLSVIVLHSISESRIVSTVVVAMMEHYPHGESTILAHKLIGAMGPPPCARVVPSA